MKVAISQPFLFDEAGIKFQMQLNLQHPYLEITDLEQLEFLLSRFPSLTFSRLRPFENGLQAWQVQQRKNLISVGIEWEVWI